MTELSWVRASKVGTSGRRAVGHVVTPTEGGHNPVGPAALVSGFGEIVPGVVYAGRRLASGSYAVIPPVECES